MITLQNTRTAYKPARRISLLNWIVSFNAAYRERARMQNLTTDELADLGLSAEDVRNTTIADIIARSAPRL